MKKTTLVHSFKAMANSGEAVKREIKFMMEVARQKAVAEFTKANPNGTQNLTQEEVDRKFYSLKLNAFAEVIKAEEQYLKKEINGVKVAIAEEVKKHLAINNITVPKFEFRCKEDNICTSASALEVVKRMDFRRVNGLSVVLQDNGVIISTQPILENRANRDKLDNTEDVSNTDIYGNKVIFRDVYIEEVRFRINTKNVKVDAFKNIVINFEHGVIFGKYKTTEEGKVLVFKTVIVADEKATDGVSTKLVVEEVDLLEKGNEVLKALYDNGAKYDIGTFSPAGIKNYAYTVKRSDSGCTIEDLTRDFGHDIIGKFIDEHKDDKELPKELFSKFAPRHGQVFSQSVCLSSDSLENIVNLNSVFDTVADRNADDGIGLISASSYAKHLNKHMDETNGIETNYTTDEVLGTRLQARPGSAKIQLFVIPDALMDVLYNQRLAKGQVVKPIPVGKTPSLMLDENAVKAKINWDNGIKLEIMATTHDTKAKLSKQMITKVFYALSIAGVNPDEIVKDLADSLYEAVKDEYKNAGKQERGNALSKSEMDILADISEDNPLVKFDSKINKLNAVAKIVDKMRIVDSEDDFYGTILPDFASIFGFRLIKDDELYTPAKSDVVVECILGKFPSLGLCEFFSAKTVTLKTLIRRLKRECARLGLSQEFQDEFIKLLKSLGKSTIILPANRVVLDTCAGLDFDFDTAVLFFGPIMRSLFGKEKLVQINSKKGKKRMLKNQDLREALKQENIILDAILAYQGLGNRDVGSITNDANVCQLALLEYLFYQNSTPALNILNSWKKKKYMGKETEGEVAVYKPLERDVIDGKERVIVNYANLEDWANNALNSDYNDNDATLVQILTDIDFVYRLYQEKTIDSTKTGEAVKILIEVLVRAKGLLQVKVETVDGIMQVVRSKGNNMSDKTKDMMMKKYGLSEDDLLFDDMFSRVQDVVIERINNEIVSGEYDKELEEAGEIREEGYYTDGFRNLVSDSYNKLRNDMLYHVEREEIREIYNVFKSTSILFFDIKAEKSKAIAKIYEEEKDEEMIDIRLEKVRNVYRAKISMLRSALSPYLLKLYDIYKELNSIRITALMQSIVMEKGGAFNPNNSSSFLFEVFPQHYIQLCNAVEHYDVRVKGQNFSVFNKEVLVTRMAASYNLSNTNVEVVDGYAKDYSFMLDTKYTGVVKEFVVRKEYDEVKDETFENIYAVIEVVIDVKKDFEEYANRGGALIIPLHDFEEDRREDIATSIAEMQNATEISRIKFLKGLLEIDKVKVIEEAYNAYVDAIRSATTKGEEISVTANADVRKYKTYKTLSRQIGFKNFVITEACYSDKAVILRTQAATTK